MYLFEGESVEPMLGRGKELLEFCKTDLASSAITIVQKFVEWYSSVVQTLLDAIASPELQSLIAKCSDGDLCEEATKELLELVGSDTGVAFYKTYKKMKNKVSAAGHDILPIVSSVADVLDLQTSVAQLQAAIEKRRAEETGIKHVMGAILAVSALFRPLQPGESREDMCSRCWKGVKDSNMKLPAPLSLLMSKLVPTAESEPAMSEVAST